MAELQAGNGGVVKTCEDRRATLFFPPAVSLTRLTFAAVLAMVKPWAGLLESNGDESRRGSQSVSPHPINRTRGEHHDRYLHLRHLFQPRRLRLPSGNWGGYWGKQGPELLDHRLALYGAEQRMVFGANTYRQFVSPTMHPTREAAEPDPEAPADRHADRSHGRPGHAAC
jgi:hypothetical protein